ncbi:MAG: TIGR04086 family membrane protein [Oscillospiraceae bacterium]|nr:TIGR04086 family membrane protein [Oscillospiraceae bacterium]
MLHNFLLTAQPWQKFAFRAISFISTCIATLGFLLCVTAFIIVRIDTPEYILIPLTTCLLTFSSFLDSLFLAKVFKENGIIIGISIGIIFVLIIIMLAICNQSFAVTAMFATKVISIMMAGMLGGILGVNS